MTAHTRDTGRKSAELRAEHQAWADARAVTHSQAGLDTNRAYAYNQYEASSAHGEDRTRMVGMTAGVKARCVCQFHVGVCEGVRGVRLHGGHLFVLQAGEGVTTDGAEGRARGAKVAQALARLEEVA